MYLEVPKNRKQRRTIYTHTTPAGYPLAERPAARAGQAHAEQAVGTNPPGLMFPSPRGTEVGRPLDSVLERVFATVARAPGRYGTALRDGRLRVGAG